MEIGNPADFIFKKFLANKEDICKKAIAMVQEVSE